MVFPSTKRFLLAATLTAFFPLALGCSMTDAQMSDVVAANSSLAPPPFIVAARAAYDQVYSVVDSAGGCAAIRGGANQSERDAGKTLARRVLCLMPLIESNGPGAPMRMLPTWMTTTTASPPTFAT